MKEDGEEPGEQMITQAAEEYAHARGKDRRVAIISDIHSNLQALEAVLVDCRGRGIGRVCCLGDIVGYGAQPAECLERIRALGGPVVIGNHDFYVAHGRVDDDISDVAMAGIRHSEAQLTAEQKRWLAVLPDVHSEKAFTIVHASLDHPMEWDYIFEKGEADASLRLQKTPVCFFGHTHMPSLFVERRLSGTCIRMDAEGVYQYRPKGRCLINPGSVGQPRGNADPAARYAILDPDAHTVEFVRVPYDAFAAAELILKAGLPPYLADRLLMGV